MGTNPVRDLITLIDGITARDVPFVSQLSDKAADGEPVEYVQMRAYTLLSEIVGVAKATGKLEQNQIVIKRLWKTISGPRGRWDQSAVPKLEGMDRAAALNFADSIDGQHLLPTPLTEEQVQGVRVALEKIEEQIRAFSEIPDGLRGYLVYLIHRGLDILNGEDVDLVALRSISFELAGAGVASSPFIPEEERSSFFQRIDEAVGPFLGAVLTNASGNLLSEMVMRALGS